MAPEDLLLAAVLGGLTLYAVLGGADFGAGAWQALLGRRMTPEEREQVHAAVGPVWEANHVWLVFVIVLLFTAFPPAFAALARALWLPLLLALGGIVLRGAAFAFRPHGPDRRRERRAWETVFAAASVAAPFFLGASLAAVAEGRLPVRADGGYDGSVLAWVSPFSLFVGLLAAASCAHLAAVYLARESSHAGDRDALLRWRMRALASAVVVGALALGGVGVLAAAAPALWEGFRERSLALVGVSAAGGVLSIVALVAGRYTVAAGGAALAVASLLWGAYAANAPYLVPPAVTVEGARAPRAVLEATAVSVAVGLALVAPALLALWRVFKSARAGRLGRNEGRR